VLTCCTLFLPLDYLTVTVTVVRCTVHGVSFVVALGAFYVVAVLPLLWVVSLRSTVVTDAVTVRYVTFVRYRCCWCSGVYVCCCCLRFSWVFPLLVVTGLHRCFVVGAFCSCLYL